MSDTEIIFNETIGFNIPIESVRAKTLGRLAVLANPSHMLAHQGDLYHDAMWLKDNLLFPNSWGPNQFVFWYGTREAGTSIGRFDRQLITPDNRDHYRITVYRKNTADRGEPDFKYSLKVERLNSRPSA